MTIWAGLNGPAGLSRKRVRQSIFLGLARLGPRKNGLKRIGSNTDWFFFLKKKYFSLFFNFFILFFYYFGGPACFWPVSPHLKRDRLRFLAHFQIQAGLIFARARTGRPVLTPLIPLSYQQIFKIIFLKKYPMFGLRLIALILYLLSKKRVNAHKTVECCQFFFENINILKVYLYF